MFSVVFFGKGFVELSIDVFSFRPTYNNKNVVGATLMFFLDHNHPIKHLNLVTEAMNKGIYLT